MHMSFLLSVTTSGLKYDQLLHQSRNQRGVENITCSCDVRKNVNEENLQDEA